MLTHFDSLFDLLAAFPDEQSCIDHIRAIRWKDGEFCPHCGGNRIYHFSDRKTFKCGDCRERFSIKVGTIFHDTKLPLRKWFMAIWMITNHPKGIASTTIAKDLKVTQKTGWHLLHRIRHAARTKSFNAPAERHSRKRYDVHWRQREEQARQQENARIAGQREQGCCSWHGGT